MTKRRKVYPISVHLDKAKKARKAIKITEIPMNEDRVIYLRNPNVVEMADFQRIISYRQLENGTSNLPASQVVDFFIFDMVARLLVDDKTKEPIILDRGDLTILFFAKDSKVNLGMFLNAMTLAFRDLFEMTKNKPELEGADGETPIDPKSST